MKRRGNYLQGGAGGRGGELAGKVFALVALAAQWESSHGEESLYRVLEPQPLR